MPAASDSGLQAALTSLLPPATLPAGIPSKLTSHATTLLNLSRQRAPNLKPEEEIARAHACAEIACRNLRVQLRLPNTKVGAGAPAKPAVYKKLIAFLEGRLNDVAVNTPKSARKRNADEALGNGRTPGSGTLKKARKESDMDGYDENMDDVQATPTKKTGKPLTISEPVGRPKRTASIVHTPRKGDKGAVVETLDDNTVAPNYVMPSIRTLCRAFGTPSLAPHVFTGMCVVLKLADLWPPNGDKVNETAYDTDIKSLIVALYIMVLTRMQKGKMTTPVYTSACSRSIATLDLANAQTVQSRIEEWIAQINQNGWAVGQDWWDSVPEGVIVFTGQPSKASDLQSASEETKNVQTASSGSKRGALTKTSSSSKAEMLRRLEEPDPEGVLLAGLGTMMQDAVDWLSEDRKSDFEEWKDGILKRIQAVDRGGGRKGKAVAT